MAIRPSKSVLCEGLDALGPVLVRPTFDLSAVAELADAHRAFGGDASARIVWGRLEGRKAFVTVLKFGNQQVVLGEVTEEVAEAIRPVAWRLRLPNRAIKCPARIDADPASSTYLHVWLNPAASTAIAARRPF